MALCDDDDDDIGAIRSYAERFCRTYTEHSMRLTTFASPTALLDHIEENGGFDLYLLDVVMPEITGIELAEIIRGRSEHAEIVFLTVSRDYAVDAFSVYASGYLIKPLRRKDFEKALLRAVQTLTREKNDALAVKTKDGFIRIPLHKIIMIESFNHIREITLVDGSSLETPSTLSELFAQLGGHENFYMPHRAYIANLDNMVGIIRYDLLMLGSRRIPIPKNQFAVVRDEVQDYLFKRKR